MTTVIKFECGSDELYVRCNLVEASAPVVWCPDTDGDWESTQYQCADCRHSIDGLAEIGLEIAREAWALTEDDDDPDWELVNPFLEGAEDCQVTDARDWYGSYGWDLRTENAGCVELQVIEYDWLDNAYDDEVAAKLREIDPEITEDEAIDVVEMARDIRESAEAVESLLDEAMEAYRDRDLRACLKALEECETIEERHGGSDVTNALRDRLIDREVVKLFE